MRYQSTVLAALVSTALAAPAAQYTTPASSTKSFTIPQATYTPPTNNTTNPTPYTPPSSANNIALIEKLSLAATAVDRLALLNDQDFIYDFNTPPFGTTTSSRGGHTVKADRKSMPALIGSGVSMTVGFIGPCGFNTPHTHPRSAEINIAVQGSLVTQFFPENGAEYFSHTLEQYQMTVFPKGALHTEFNPGCEDAVFVAAFASEDPGVQQAAQAFFGLDGEIVKAALDVEVINGKDVEAFRSMIPANVALGVESCLAKCGIQKR